VSNKHSLSSLFVPVSKLFRSRKLFQNICSVLCNFSLLLNIFLPYFVAIPAYAEEPTPTPIVEEVPTPTLEPTITETPTEPTATPTEEPIVTPEPTIEPTATPTEEPIVTPEPTITPTIIPEVTTPPAEDNNQPSGNNSSSSPTPLRSPEPTAPVATPTILPLVLGANVDGGIIETMVVENTSCRTDLLNPIISSDKADYAPAEIAIITGGGFAVNTDYLLVITGEKQPSQTYNITSDSTGNFTYSYQLFDTYIPDYKVELTSLAGLVLATTTFTDSVCGNDIKEDGEQCDGTDLGNASLSDFKCSKKCELELVKDKVTICHSSSSSSNYYVINTPNKSGDLNGHASDNGPVWYPGITVVWGDIIPPFNYLDGGVVKNYPGLNWSTEGQAIWNNDCEIPERKATIKVIKQFTNIGDADQTVFPISISGNGQITGSTTGSISSSVSVTFEVTPGTYSVSETLPDGWKQDINGCASVTVGVAVNEITVWDGVCNIYNSKIITPCGDGFLDETTEECDGTLGVGAHQICTNQCKLENLPYCGDGNIDRGEQCDDGNTSDEDGCDSTCKLEKKVDICHWDEGNNAYKKAQEVSYNSIYKWNEGEDECETKGHGLEPLDIIPPFINGDCSYSGQNYSGDNIAFLENGCETPAPVCGNETVETGETCDDGNTVNGDGCSSTCQIEELSPPSATISKSNDAVGNIPPGGSVGYKIKVIISGNDINEFKVTDLLSNGFKYRSGSYNVLKNGINITGGITEPQYHSPGVWNLGNLSIGDTVELSYIADISSDHQPGIYTDLAYARGKTTYGTNDPVYAVGEDSKYVNENFVGTEVPIVASTQNSISAGVEKHEEGQVLGASTELPSTGSNNIWLIISTLMALLGFTLLKKSSKKLIAIILFAAFYLFPSNALAVVNPLSVRLKQPISPTNISNLKLTFVALEIDGVNPITVKCFKKGPSDSGYGQMGSNITLSAPGNTDDCVTDSSTMNAEGTYQFYVTANGLSSNTVSVDYKTSGPGTPSDYRKDRPSTCDYKIHFKTADDGGKTVKVEIYRADVTSFILDAGSVVASIPVGSNQERDVTNTVPDCNKEYYYVLRAFDDAGNGSGTIGDSVTITSYSTIVTTTTSAAIPVTGVNLPQEEIVGEGDIPATNEEGQVLGTENLTSTFFAKYWKLLLLFLIIIASIIYVALKKKRARY